MGFELFIGEGFKSESFPLGIFSLLRYVLGGSGAR